MTGEVLSISQAPGTDNTITFTDADLEGVNPNHNEAFVVSMEILNNVVRKVFIDNGSSLNIIFMHCWERHMSQGFKIEKCPDEALLYGFGHNTVPIAGIARLPILFGQAPKEVMHHIKLYVVNTPSTYNMLLGRPTLTLLRTITSTTHLKIKFPVSCGIGEIKGDF